MTRSPHYLNLGCGKCFSSSPEWISMDVAPADKASVHQYHLLLGIPFADNSFDAVYHSHVLEHFPRQQVTPFLRECLRVLRPGGTLRIAVPDGELHQWMYDDVSLAALLREAGFLHIRTCPCHTDRLGGFQPDCNEQGAPLLRLTGGETATMRLFESVGGVSLTFTEERARLTRHFSPGEDLETYATPDELVEKIRHYLAHPEDRARLASSGQRRCRSVFSKRRQAEEFLSVTRRKLEEKKQHTARPADPLKPLSSTAKTRMLELLCRCDPEDNAARELEKELFITACLLARSGFPKEARALDQAMTQTPFVRHDLGALMHACIC